MWLLISNLKKKKQHGSGEAGGSRSHQRPLLSASPSGPPGHAGGGRPRGGWAGGGARACASCQAGPAPGARPRPAPPPPLALGCGAGGRCGDRRCCFLGPFCRGATGEEERRGDPRRGAASRRRRQPHGARTFRDRGGSPGETGSLGRGTGEPRPAARRAPSRPLHHELGHRALGE